MLAIGVLGRLQLGQEEQPVEVGRRAVRTLLACLTLCAPQPASLAQLAEVMWEGDDWSDGSLRVHVTRARKALAGAGHAIEIVHTQEGYRLVGDVPTDASSFEELLAQAEAATDPATVVALTERALARWRGRPYDDLGEASFTRPERVRLAERRWRVESLLAGALVELGRPDDALAHLRVVVEREPRREAAVEQAMRTSWRLGREVEAAELFEAHRQRLDQHGLRPGRALWDLLRRVHANDRPEPETPPPSASTSLARALRAASTAVPALGTSFVGRDDVLAEVDHRLRSGRLVTIVGPAGVGKTRLAAELARRQPERVVWIDLALHTATEVEEALASALGLGWTGGDDLAERLLAALRAEPMLIVFDNCEHVVDEAATLAESLMRHGATTVRILCTSRAPLQTPSERVVRLAPLDDATSYDLYCDRAGHLGTAPPDAWRPDELSEWSAGLPLAIEMAAASPRSRHGAGLPAMRRGDERHRSIGAALDVSLGALTDAELQFFDAIGVLAGRFEAADAAAVAGVSLVDAQRLLARLETVSLVNIADPTRSVREFRLLEPLREAALERLRSGAAPAEVERRHRDHLVRTVGVLARELERAHELRAVERLEGLDAQLRRVWEGATADATADHHDRLATAVRIAADLQNYSFLRLVPTHVAWTRRLAEEPGAEDCDGFPELVGGASMSAWAYSDVAAAEAYATRSIEASERTGVALSVYALSTKQNVSGTAGRIEEAIDCFTRVQDWAVATDDPFWMSLTATTEAIVGSQMGDLTMAFKAADRALRHAEVAENRSMQAWALHGRGYAHLAARDHAIAADVFRESVQLAVSVRNRWVQGMSTAGLATALRRSEQLDESAELLVELAAHWYRGSMYGQLGATLAEIALLAVAFGRDDLARLVLRARSTIPLMHPLLPTEAVELSAVKKQLKLPVGKFIGDATELFAELMTQLPSDLHR